MLFIIFILVLIIVFLISSQIYPVAEKRVKAIQDKKIEKTTRELDNMFIFVQRSKLLYFSIFSVLIFAALGLFFFKNPVAAFLGAFLGFMVPSLWINLQQKQRRQKFNNQLIDALMLLTASLKAGLSLTQAFEELVEEMPPPISQEFDLVIKELNMGVSFEEAVMRLKKRMRSEDLDLIITAISIARETGGQLPAVFSKLVFTIKERQTLRGKVGALTIQAKLQGLIMSLLPVVFVVVVYKFNPEHFEYLLKDATGKMLLIYAVFSQIVGVFLIFKFSKVEI